MAHANRVRAQPRHHRGMRIQGISTTRNPGHSRVSGHAGRSQGASPHGASGAPKCASDACPSWLRAAGCQTSFPVSELQIRTPE
jgi:hypothetical protein